MGIILVQLFCVKYPVISIAFTIRGLIGPCAFDMSGVVFSIFDMVI